MAIFLFSFAFILVSIMALAIGVLLQRRPLAGSCGGADASGGCACGRSNQCESGS